MGLSKRPRRCTMEMARLTGHVGKTRDGRTSRSACLSVCLVWTSEQIRAGNHRAVISSILYCSILPPIVWYYDPGESGFSRREDNPVNSKSHPTHNSPPTEIELNRAGRPTRRILAVAPKLETCSYAVPSYLPMSPCDVMTTERGSEERPGPILPFIWLRASRHGWGGVTHTHRAWRPLVRRRRRGGNSRG